MGLLDIWNDWRSGVYAPKQYEWGSQETDIGNLNTAGGIKNKRGIIPKKPLKNRTSPNGYCSDHLTIKSIKENAQTDINMYKKPN